MCQSPWGKVQDRKTIAHGIVLVSTASHGGYLLNASALALMPAALRAVPTWAGDGAYEEDCDWAIVALAFPQHFDDFALLCAVETVRGDWADVKRAQPWLTTTDEGRAVAARADAFRTANAHKYRQGSCGTSGSGWTVFARNLADTERIEVRFPDTPHAAGVYVSMAERLSTGFYALPQMFDLADVARCGGIVVPDQQREAA